MSIDRLERRLPEVLTELSLPVMPDYVDNLLSRTERMSQRPGWSFPERWFPMSTITSAVPARRPLSLRPLVVLAVILALIAASIAIYVGSRPRPAPLTGLARNGLVVTTSAAGDLIAVDPVTETQRTLAAGPNICCAQVSRDGLRVALLNLPSVDAAPTRLRVIDLEGSILRDVPAAELRGLIDYALSPDGSRLLLTSDAQPRTLEVASGRITPLDVPDGVTAASWIGTTGDILLTFRVDEATLRIARLPAGATRGESEITRLRYAVDAPKVSPDGSRFLYFIWGTEQNQQGRLHVYDFAGRTDTEVSPPEAPGSPHESEWENPVWSPDGSFIAVELYTTAENHVVVIPAAGGQPVAVGPTFPTGSGGAVIRFSPDGQSILATYRFSNETWLLPVSGADGRQVTWTTAEDIDWQRLAP